MHHRISLNCLLALVLSLALAGPVRAQQAVDVTQVALQVPVAVQEAARLDVGLVIFDPGIPADVSSHDALGVFPELRKAEARYMPVLLRQVLIDSGAWGVVRVMPEAAVLPELLVRAEIVQSDGQQLALKVQARDATGRLWLERLYRDNSAAADYPVQGEGDPYLDLYHQLANDLLRFRDSLSPDSLREIRRVAFLRYAATLSPEAFAGYLAGGDETLYSVTRLPAEGDPMLARVERIRNQEYLFIDTVDEQYLTLYRELAPTYHLWRQYSREQALYLEEYQQRVANRKSSDRRGSFSAMQRSYDAFRNLKIQQQDLDEQVLGFNNEVEPTFLQVSGRVFRLNGTLDSQYHEWRGILRDIFRLETGLPAS